MSLGVKFIPSAVFLLALIAVSSFISAQTPDFTSIDFGKSGESMKVESIAQDNQNHLYFGTSKGLLKYDGLEMKPIALNDSLMDLSITALLYHENVVWIGTSTGQLYTWDGEKAHEFLDSAFTGSAKISALKGIGDCIGVATYGEGVYVLMDDHVDRHYTTENGLGDNYSYDLEMHNNRLWIGTDAGITEVDTAEDATFLYSMRNGLPDNIVKTIVPYSDSTIAIGMYDMGICLLNTKRYTFSYFSENQQWSHGPVEKMLKSADGMLWVATKSDGIIWADLSSNDQSIRAFSQINGLESNRIQSLFEDAEHNVWIGTSRGASLYAGSNVEFLTSDEGLPAQNIYDVLVDQNGDYWFASEQSSQIHHEENRTVNACRAR